MSSPSLVSPLARRPALVALLVLPALTRRPVLVALPVLLALLALLAASCGDTERERLCRIAAKSVVAAPEDKVRGEVLKLVAYGRYALPDIEQEFHAAPAVGRLRLLDAVRRLRLAETRTFLRVVARWDDSADVRAQAALAERELPR